MDIYRYKFYITYRFTIELYIYIIPLVIFIFKEVTRRRSDPWGTYIYIYTHDLTEPADAIKNTTEKLQKRAGHRTADAIKQHYADAIQQHYRIMQ